MSDAESFSMCFSLDFSSHRQSSTGSVVVTATCATTYVSTIKQTKNEGRGERTTPIVAFDYGFLTQENADTRYGQTGATCCERKGATASSISFLVVFIKVLGFRTTIVKCDHEPSAKALQHGVIQACAGVEVIPQGPPEGDHMANGRVAMAVREVKRQCRTLRLSAEENTSVRIADDSPLLSWFPRSAAQVITK